MSNFLSFKGDKLVSISNYIEWKTNADLFLEINDYMSYIDGTKESLSKSLYYKIETSTNKEGKETRSYNNALLLKLSTRYFNRLLKYNRNNKRALNVLKSIILLNNNNRFKNKIIAKDLY
jgi:hypothetical protein